MEKLFIFLLCPFTVLCCFGDGLYLEEYPELVTRPPLTYPPYTYPQYEYEPQLDIDAYCNQEADNYNQYCSEQQEKPSESLPATYCETYVEYCPVQKPQAVQCTWSCKDPHCTVRCQCKFYSRNAVDLCLIGQKSHQKDPAYFERHCAHWWKRCNQILTPHVRNDFINIWEPVLKKYFSKPHSEVDPKFGTGEQDFEGVFIPESEKPKPRAVGGGIFSETRVHGQDFPVYGPNQGGPFGHFADYPR